MFLTHDELKEWSDATRWGKQIAWLQEHGVRFVLSSVGRPKVLQSEMERVMLGGPVKKKKEPNFSRING